MAVHDVNEGVELTLTFKDRDGVARNPTVGELKIVAPGGTTTTVATSAMANPSAGVFKRDLVFTEPGTWVVRATCSDEVAPVVGEKEYFVREPRF